MRLKLGATRKMDGRDCVALAITPHPKAPNMIDGELWTDASDGSIVEIDGLASMKPSIFAGSPSPKPKRCASVLLTPQCLPGIDRNRPVRRNQAG